MVFPLIIGAGVLMYCLSGDDKQEKIAPPDNQIKKKIRGKKKKASKNDDGASQ